MVLNITELGKGLSFGDPVQLWHCCSAAQPLSDALPILVVVKIPIPFSPPYQCSGHINYFHTAQLVLAQTYLEQEQLQHHIFNIY